MSLGPVEPFIKCICHDDIIPQNGAEVLKTAEDIKKTLNNVTEEQKDFSIQFSSGKLQGSNTQWKDQLVALAIQIEECRTRIKQGFERLPFVEESKAIVTCWKVLAEIEQLSYRERKNNTYMSLLLNGAEEKIEKNAEPDPAALETTSYMNSLKDVPLETKRYFEQGISLVNWRYPNIYKIIEKIQQTATGLQKIEAGVEDKISKAWQGAFIGQFPTKEAPSLRACLKELKKTLTQQQNELAAITFSTEVQAGMHYAASLFAWIDAIERRITFLAKSTENSRTKVCYLQQLLFNNANKPNLTQQTDARTSYQAIQLLYTTIQALHKLSHSKDKSRFFEEHKTQVITTVKSSLAMIGKKVFFLPDQEKQMEQMILARMSLEGLSDTTLKTLLLKKIVHALHFTTDAFDISLDLLLTTLETHPGYADIWKNIQNDEELAHPVSAYKEQWAFAQDSQLPSKLCTIAFLMTKTISQKPDAAYIFGLYAQYQQLLYEARNASLCNRSIHWLDCFLKQTESLFSAVKTRYHYKEYYSDLHSIVIPEASKIMKNANCDPIIYKLALQALWATNVQEQEEARKVIDSLATTQMYNYMTDRIKYLLRRLALERLFGDHPNGLSATEKAYLPKAFVEHLKSPSFWEHQFDSGTMENGLNELLHTFKIESTLLNETIKGLAQDMQNLTLSTV